MIASVSWGHERVYPVAIVKKATPISRSDLYHALYVTGSFIGFVLGEFLEFLFGQIALGFEQAGDGVFFGPEDDSAFVGWTNPRVGGTNPGHGLMV